MTATSLVAHFGKSVASFEELSSTFSNKLMPSPRFTYYDLKDLFLSPQFLHLNERLSTLLRWDW
jgi:hypothetical protein